MFAHLQLIVLKMIRFGIIYFVHFLMLKVVKILMNETLQSGDKTGPYPEAKKNKVEASPIL